MRMIIIFVDLEFIDIYNKASMKYKTKHRTELVSYLMANSNRHLTIQEIQNELKDMPQATLYRLMDSLVEEGIVRKYVIGPSQSNCFQYSSCEHEHFHLICESCGKLIHLDCHEVEKLLTHIKCEHGFDINISKVNLYGICEECRKEGQK